jgi:hypothetical protein
LSQAKLQTKKELAKKDLSSILDSRLHQAEKLDHLIMFLMTIPTAASFRGICARQQENHRPRTRKDVYSGMRSELVHESKMLKDLVFH